jgi:glutamyl-tRNA synthetase
VRSRGGRFVMRVEDLDQPRVRRGAEEEILADLRWLGLDWDEGPDTGGPHAPYRQWERLRHYDEAFEQLRAAGHLYPCFCSRKDIQAAASAPQLPSDEVRYPGTCARLTKDESRERIDSGRTHAWRFHIDVAALPEFEDRILGRRRWAEGLPPGDFVVRRADGVPAYQLAVVVDDAAMEINEVVRGDDLLPSTFRQLLLYRALGLTAPAFGHVPLLLGADGVRLSKRHEGTSLRELRERGFHAEAIVGRLAHLLGVAAQPEPATAESLAAGFAITKVVKAPQGLVVDPGSWRQAPGLTSFKSSGVGT